MRDDDAGSRFVARFVIIALALATAVATAALARCTGLAP